MKITQVESVPFRVPIHGFADAYTGFSSSNAVLVRISTDEGVQGIAEACAWEPEFYGETLESVHSTIEHYVAPALVGENPMEIHRLLTIVDGKLAKSTCVKEGLDLALHDLVGKALGVPVYQLLGGAFRDSIPVASEIGIDSPASMGENARRVLDLGIRVVKIKGSNDPQVDVERIHAVREAVGPNVELRLDPNAAWNTIDTIKTMRAVESCRLQLLEQPVAAWDLKGMAHIRANVSVPLMADESVWTPQDAIRIAEYGAADILNIKIAKSCGLSLAKKIEAVAEATGLVCIVGTEIEPGFSIAAKLHLAASMKNHPLASEFTELSLLQLNVLTHRFEIREGSVAVPGGPGLGVELDEDAFEKVRA